MYKAMPAWPVHRSNPFCCCYHICSQNEQVVIENMGKFDRVVSPGIFFINPLLESIRYVIDMREQTTSIYSSSAITSDNVNLNIGGILYWKFINPERAAYGSNNPIYAVIQHAIASMRVAIGKLELDRILHDRHSINHDIKNSIATASESWGIEILRYEITDVNPDPEVAAAMDKQAVAERTRREQLIDAESQRKTMELHSEGQKIKLKNESEGNLIRSNNEAEAAKIRLTLQAEADAMAIKLVSQAKADAILVEAEAKEKAAKILMNLINDGGDAAKYAITVGLSNDLFNMYGKIGEKSNTIFFHDKPADLPFMLAQVQNNLASSQNQITNTKK